MRPPAFWYTPPDAPSLMARALNPISALAAHATARRLRQPGYAAQVPIICIGNINLGGTGKTPTSIALAQRLTDRGHTPHIVSRGYGGNLSGPVRVGDHTATQTGDEPLLLAAFAPTWVAKDRAAGVRAAEAAGADVILLDDGFQNPSVVKDLSIVVVDAQRGFGNGRVVPAGPLREPLRHGLDRADLLLSIGPEAAQARFQSTWSDQVKELPHLRGTLVPLPTGMPWTDLKLLAFAGIGHPEKFFQTLRGMGAHVVRGQPLDDHQPLTETLMKRLETEAKSANAQLVTTEKDAVRLPQTFRSKVLTLPVRLEIENWTLLDMVIEQVMKKSRQERADHSASSASSSAEKSS